MKLTPDKRRDGASATITHTLVLIGAVSGLCALTAMGSPPSWWNSRGATHAVEVTTNDDIVTTNYITNDYAVVTQGQLKQFTARAVDELNADLATNGGAGPALSNLVYGWQQDYLTNGYATNTANLSYPYKPADFQAVNVGQLKYIASLIYGQLYDAGYTGFYPSWIQQNTHTDSVAANIGQLKTVFNFDLSLAGPTALTATSNTNGAVILSWTPPATNQATSYILEQQMADGSWTNIATLGSSFTSYTVTNLATGEQPEFQIVAEKGSSESIAQTTPADTALVAPSNVHAIAGAAPGEIDVTWQNNSSNATYNLVYESHDGVNWNVIATINDPTITEYAVTNLTVGQSYYFAVAAGNN